MKELTFSRFFIMASTGNSPFDEELVCFFPKMAADRGISLSCFLKVEVILEV